MKEVYTVTNYKDKQGNEKSFWQKVGTAFENKDGSLSVNLNALPVNGKLVIQDKKEWKESGNNNMTTHNEIPDY